MLLWGRGLGGLLGHFSVSRYLAHAMSVRYGCCAICSTCPALGERLELSRGSEILMYIFTWTQICWAGRRMFPRLCLQWQPLSSLLTYLPPSASGCSGQWPVASTAVQPLNLGGVWADHPLSSQRPAGLDRAPGMARPLSYRTQRGSGCAYFSTALFHCILAAVPGHGRPRLGTCDPNLHDRWILMFYLLHKT